MGPATSAVHKAAIRSAQVGIHAEGVFLSIVAAIVKNKRIVTSPHAGAGLDRIAGILDEGVPDHRAAVDAGTDRAVSGYHARLNQTGVAADDAGSLILDDAHVLDDREGAWDEDAIVRESRNRPVAYGDTLCSAADTELRRTAAAEPETVQVDCDMRSLDLDSVRARRH